MSTYKACPGFMKTCVCLFKMCFCMCKQKKERARQRESKCLQDLMIECSTNMIVITWCLSLSCKSNLTHIITIPPPSVKGRRTARTSKLISLSSCSAFVSQDNPSMICFPVNLVVKHALLSRACVFSCIWRDVCLSTWCWFVFCNTSLAEELLRSVFVYLIGTWRDVTFNPIKMVSYSGWDHVWGGVILFM